MKAQRESTTTQDNPHVRIVPITFIEIKCLTYDRHK